MLLFHEIIMQLSNFAFSLTLLFHFLLLLDTKRKFMKQIIALCVFAFTSLVLPMFANAQMLEIGSDSRIGMVVSINPLTETVQYDEAGFLTFGYVVQIVETGTPVQLNKSYVRIVDCKAGTGYVYVRNMNNYYQFKSPWVNGGASVASATGTLFCSVAKQKNVY